MKTALRLAALALIPDFGGTCRTFGPGDYASLPWGLDNAVSSGRRISSENPYSGAPNWRR
ncbi:MAG: hypothetical protein ACYC9Z_12450 [Casimicrobiaceae bacterium]